MLHLTVDMTDPPRAPRIRFTMPDGSVWSCDAPQVAAHRAAYYAHEDGAPDPDTKTNAVYANELAYTLGSDNELLDWTQNQMDWADLGARMDSPPPAVDYASMAHRATRTVIR